MQGYMKASDLTKYQPNWDEAAEAEGDAGAERFVQISADELTSIIGTLTYYENLAGDEFKAPTLGNATTPFLCEELITVRKSLKPLGTYEKLLKNLLKARKEAGETDFPGITWNHVEKRIISKDAFMAKYGVEAWDEVCKDSVYDEARISK